MISEYKNKDLKLKVSENEDVDNLISVYETFMELIFDEKYYFLKESCIEILRYLFNEKYVSIESLAEENYSANHALQKKYGSLNSFLNSIQLKGKKSCSVDLATGTGKSYLIYAVAQIALHSKLVDQVLVLCPSNTIEDGLTDKFNQFVSDLNLLSALPKNSSKIPRIISASQTILEGDICVENIHAVYANTNSSIRDSLMGNGKRTLILNDEAHHIFNKVVGVDKQDIKEWKKFLMSEDYGFIYIVNFSGTPYIGNEYFADVIYQYPLRRAIDEKVVKNPNWLVDISSKSIKNNYQIMYQNHLDNKGNYPDVKPITIIVCADINRCYKVYEDVVKFITTKENLNKSEAEKKVIWVVSSKPEGANEKDRLNNLALLKSVDLKSNPVEWIVSVAMLTEGWDVKNVFQIVPHESKAFNSKLLIAQVLGRGLRVPQIYSNHEDLKVRVFNHEKFSEEIKNLFDQVIEVNDNINLSVQNIDEYNFELDNISYAPVEKYVYERKSVENFTGFFNLKPQVKKYFVDTKYEDIFGRAEIVSSQYEGDHLPFPAGVNNIYSHLKALDLENRTNITSQYTFEKISEMLRLNPAIGQSDFISMENLNLVKNSFYKLWDFGGETTTFELTPDCVQVINTRSINYFPVSAGSLRNTGNHKLYYSIKFMEKLNKLEQGLLNELLENKDYFRIEEISEIKSPAAAVIGSHKNEIMFLNRLLSPSSNKSYDAFIKNPDRGFYSFPYAFKQGTHMVHNQFNPDFIIKKNSTILIVEIKDDQESSLKTRSKMLSAQDHVGILNSLQSKRVYSFVLLSPNDYDAFFNSLSFDNYLEFNTELMSRLKLQIDDVISDHRSKLRNLSVKTFDGFDVGHL